MFWYYSTPRKIPYLVISVNLVKFGSHGLSVLGATLQVKISRKCFTSRLIYHTTCRSNNRRRYCHPSNCRSKCRRSICRRAIVAFEFSGAKCGRSNKSPEHNVGLRLPHFSRRSSSLRNPAFSIHASRSGCA